MENKTIGNIIEIQNQTKIINLLVEIKKLLETNNVMLSQIRNNTINLNPTLCAKYAEQPKSK